MVTMVMTSGAAASAVVARRHACGFLAPAHAWAIMGQMVICTTPFLSAPDLQLALAL